MDKKAAIDRVQGIIKAWVDSLASYPPEVAAAKTTLVVLREPDIQAMQTLCTLLREKSD